VETSELSIVLSTEKSLNVTLGKTTKIALEGRNAFLVGDDGRERKLRIISKEALHPDQSPK
jgi:hypothetical protein